MPSSLRQSSPFAFAKGQFLRAGHGSIITGCWWRAKPTDLRGGKKFKKCCMNRRGDGLRSGRIFQKRFPDNTRNATSKNAFWTKAPGSRDMPRIACKGLENVSGQDDPDALSSDLEAFW
jgi:hypothetical protein